MRLRSRNMLVCVFTAVVCCCPLAAEQTPDQATQKAVPSTTVPSGKTSATEPAGTGLAPQFSFYAEAEYRARFSKGRRQRAFVVGPDSYAWSTGHSRSRYAIRKATRLCDNLRQRSPQKQVRDGRCAVYAVNDRIVFEGELPALPIGTPLPGEDVTLKKAFRANAMTVKPRGILVLLHGCDKPVLSRLPHWVKGWFRFFRQKGFHVLAPYSYADERPGSLCGKVAPAKYADRSRILRIRTAQTLRTLRVLQEQYPGLPIIVWGQSEGGVVAQAISARIGGVISTGAECGIGITGSLLVRSNVPLLVVVGSKDRFINVPKKLTREAVRDYCKKVLSSPRWRHVYLEGVGHFPNIGIKALQLAVAEFIEESVRRWEK